jgi:hypothetical protein
MKYTCDLCERVVGQVYDTSKGSVCNKCYDEVEKEEEDSA